MVGAQLGRYRIIRQIGAGGMGVVYRAHDERLGRNVAIKVLPPDVLSDEVVRRRFHKEALALSKLNHPNIAILYDFDTQDGADFLVMEEVTGASLDTLLAAGPLEPAEVMRFGEQLADALAAAHQRGILHRDLKPSNLRLTQDGRLKVLDFGLARTLHDMSLSTASISDFGPAAGTLPYMAPEQLAGEEPDFRSDIYVAGTVLFEMASGHHPFEHKSGPGLVGDVMYKPAPSLRMLVPGIFPELDRIIGKCLEKNPGNRYQSARELAVDLRRLQISSATATGLAPRGYFAPWLRNAVSAGVAIAVLTLLLLIRGRHPAPNRLQYVQLTHFTDAAVAPALSPDGRMLTYLRGPATTFGNTGQRETNVWAQLLPNGEASRLTNDDQPKGWPVFSPDGSHIAYSTIVGQTPVWATWQVSVLGGDARQLMTNADGLTWTSNSHYLYSKVIPNEGQHMAVATASESLSDERLIYVPRDPNGMAHRSFLSPNRKWLLIVEMDASGTWLPCRLMPFDASSAGRPVGPANGQCTAAGWAPDGKWMYLTANVSGEFHLWRQRFPDGEPEQLTLGPTEEEGVSMAPDGTSLLTAAGTRLSTVWFHNKDGDRQITSDGFGLLPTLSPDGKAVYYLRKSGMSSRGYVSGELWRADVASARGQPALPGVGMTYYSLSHDGRKVLYTSDSTTPPGIWIADLDRRTPPRQLTTNGEDRACFGAAGEIIYVSGGPPSRLMRMKEDGSNRQAISPDPIEYLQDVSPNGQWALVNTVGVGGGVSELRAYSIGDGKSMPVCGVCVAGFGPRQARKPFINWAPDGRFFYLSLHWANLGHANKTAVIPVPGAPLNLAPHGNISEADLQKTFGARIINERDVYPGPNPDTYVFTRYVALTNIYRIILH
jgi:eukaryotic-like serine/threonine-protein kinase